MTYASTHPNHVLAVLRSLRGITTDGVPGLTVRAIADHVGAPADGVRRALRVLNGAGHIDARPHPRDGRMILYHVAP